VPIHVNIIMFINIILHRYMLTDSDEKRGGGGGGATPPKKGKGGES
jgi:hypothetical protein